jgi:hypothetical protein
MKPEMNVMIVVSIMRVARKIWSSKKIRMRGTGVVTTGIPKRVVATEGANGEDRREGMAQRPKAAKNMRGGMTGMIGEQDRAGMRTRSLMTLLAQSAGKTGNVIVKIDSDVQGLTVRAMHERRRWIHDFLNRQLSSSRLQDSFYLYSDNA